MSRSDQVWKQFSRQAFGGRRGNQKAAWIVRPESGDLTHDIAFGLKPEQFYTGKVVIRRSTKAAA